MEIELKLALPAGHAAKIRRHPLLREIKPTTRKLHSVYFDTPDFALMRRGIALRLRRVGYHWVQTMKAEARAVGAMSSRPEWETSVAGGADPDFAVLPREALDLLKGIDLKRVVPAFITEFQRTAWHLEVGRSRVELALDQGAILAGEARASISEVELELKLGRPADLFGLADALLDLLPLRVEPRSKAERGYQLCDAARRNRCAWRGRPSAPISPRVKPGSRWARRPWPRWRPTCRASWNTPRTSNTCTSCASPSAACAGVGGPRQAAWAAAGRTWSRPPGGDHARPEPRPGLGRLPAMRPCRPWQRTC
jgi:hypothetical protein